MEYDAPFRKENKFNWIANQNQEREQIPLDYDTTIIYVREQILLDCESKSIKRANSSGLCMIRQSYM